MGGGTRGARRAGMDDVVGAVLEQLRINDGTCAPYSLLAYETDVQHPCGFNGHNHHQCKIPTLICKRTIRDGRPHFAFVELDCNNEEHRLRRAEGRRPRWNDAEVWFDATNMVGAATYLALRMRYCSDLDVVHTEAAEALVVEGKELGDTRFRHSGHIGSIKVEDTASATNALAVMCGMVVVRRF